MQRTSAHAASEARTRSSAASTVFVSAWPALPAIGVLVAALLLLAFDDGGYFPAAFLSAGAIAFIALAVLLVTSASRVSLSTHALLALGALAALAAWIGLSSRWSTVPDTPLLDMQRAMLYLALFGLALVAADSRRHARLLVWSVLAVILAIVGAGLLSRLQPDVVTGTTDEFTNIGFRLGYPLEYWNAFGALASIGAVLALGLAADRRSPLGLRAGAAGVATLFTVAMYMSLSRGAWLALITGVVALLALSPNRLALLASLSIVGAAVAVAVLRLRSYPALISDPRAGSGQAAQGNTFTLELLLLVASAIAAQGALAASRLDPELKRHAVALRRPLLIGAGALMLAAAMGSYALQGRQFEDRVTGAAKEATVWFDRQWQDFVAPTATTTAGQATGPARLLSAQGGRGAGYAVVIDGFEAHPLRGEGAGSFEVRWMQTRDLDGKLRDAHSLPLETLGELGAVGLLLLLGFVAAVAVGARRCLQGCGVIRQAEAAAVTAAFVVWFTHACVDWDWEMPALTGTALTLCAALFQRGRKRRSRSGAVAAPA